MAIRSAPRAGRLPGPLPPGGSPATCRPAKKAGFAKTIPTCWNPTWPQSSALASDAGQQEQLAALAAQLSLVRRELDGPLYDRLPRAVIHGDFHPGNVRFRGPQVAASTISTILGCRPDARPERRDDVLRLASPAAVRRRRHPPNDAAVHPRRGAFAPLLAGYECVSRLTGPEWEALAGLIRSRWLQIRLRGSRKVPAAEKVAFVLHDLFQVVAWLDGPGIDFFQRLRRECQRQ